MKDLINIPEKFHILFNSDWNKGVESEMTSMSKSDMNNLFLEYNRWNIQQALKPAVKEEVIIGFEKI